MPTYEYECLKCGHKFDAFQKMSDAHLDKCPKCAALVRRLISGGSGLIFKGSGFYATDYKKSSAASKAKADAHGSSSCSCCPKQKSGECKPEKTRDQRPETGGQPAKP